jgi:hypothetical protein
VLVIHRIDSQLQGPQTAAVEHGLEVFLSYAPHNPNASLPKVLDDIDGLVVIGYTSPPGLRGLLSVGRRCR